MTAQEIIESVKKQRKGTYLKLTKSKDLGNGCSKTTDMVIRTGIDYYNMKENENKPRQGLAWGSYEPGLEGYVINHTNKEGVQKRYLRVYDSGSNIQTKSKYFKDGVEVSRDEIVQIVGEKKLESKKASCYTIDFNNIVSIG